MSDDQKNPQLLEMGFAGAEVANFKSMLSPSLIEIMSWLSNRTMELMAVDNGQEYLRCDPLFELTQYAFIVHPVVTEANRASFGSVDAIDVTPQCEQQNQYKDRLDDEIRAHLSPHTLKRYSALIDRFSEAQQSIHDLLGDPAFVQEAFSVMESSEYTGAAHQADFTLTPQRREMARSTTRDFGHG